MSAAERPEPKQRLSAILKLGNTREAIAQIKQLLVEFPRFLHARIKLGLIYRRLGDRQAAFDIFADTVELFPRHRNARLQLAEEQLYFQQLEPCRQNIDELLRLDPHNARGTVKLGQIYQQQGDDDEAYKLFRTAVQLDPQFTPGSICLALELKRRQQYKQAKELLCQALVYAPHHFALSIHLGHIERHREREREAANYFRQALEQAQNLRQGTNAKLLLARTQIELGAFKKAKLLVEELLQQFPENRQAQLIKGNVLQQELDFAAAIALYEKILAAEPTHLPSRLAIAKIYSQTGRVQEAIACLEKTCRMLETVNIQTLIQLGLLHQANENYASASFWYQKAYREYPEHHQGYCRQANLYALQGNLDAALELLAEAQAKIPHAQAIVISLARLHTQAGNVKVSQQILDGGIANFGDRTMLLIQLSQVYKMQGNLTAALSTLEAINSDRKTLQGRIAKLKADIYCELYNYEQAELHLHQAINLQPTAPAARDRLAAIYTIYGRVAQAQQQLKAATADLNRQITPGKTRVPLRSHVAFLLNELRINPCLLTELEAAHRQDKQLQIMEFARLLTMDSSYLGAAICLTRELRAQGIFEELKQFFNRESINASQIPQRIVQFWDEAEPPAEVLRISHSWREHNPDYEYRRFSLKTAISFLEDHYDGEIVRAFLNCDRAATQADFFRLAYLNQFGGFYADMDDMCQQSLDPLVNSGAELIVVQEHLACFGNNFLGCIPQQSMIRASLKRAADNLNNYQNETPWLTTGPALITSMICHGLVPHLSHRDYRLWPQLLVLTVSESRKIVMQHLALSYKQTNRSWQKSAYQKQIKAISI
ncbi:MAG: tetratricopeptide repeat protein [Cyanobacteria bacterium J06623_7]